MKKTIDIKGISTSSAYSEGDCISVVNMRKKNGVMRPVSPRKVTKTLAHEYTYTFTHNLPQVGENLLGYRSGKLYHIIDNSEIDLNVNAAELKSITQLGNILNILTDTGVKYLFWVDSAYKLIESNFGGAQTDSLLLPVKVDLKVDGITNSQGEPAVKYFRGVNREYQNLTDMNNENIIRTDEYKSLFSKSEGILKNDGYLTGFIQACTAIELYDGNYILHSNPILIGQPFDAGQRYKMNTPLGIRDYNSTDRMNFNLSRGGVYNSETESWDKNITSGEAIYTDFFRENGIIGSYLADTADYPDAGYFYTFITPSITGDVSYATVMRRMQDLKFKISSNISTEFKTLIKSISIFISPEVSFYDTTKDGVRKTRKYGETSGGDIYIENYYPSTKTDADIIKELSDNQQFYKVHEIPFDDIKTTTENDGWITIDLKDKLGENLVNQEELPVDNFTHHTLLPNKQMVYNSKLHVMDYKQELFHGWPLEYFFGKNGVGQFPAIYGNMVYGRKWWVEVFIKTETGTSIVVRSLNMPSGTLDFDLPKLNMLSYPDSRAFKMVVYMQISPTGESTYKTEYRLTSSTTHNFAYYIPSDLKPIYGTENSQLIELPPAETNRTLIYRNTMKVSAINNPFYFPSVNTYTVGTGIIRNAGTNALRMSEGQFGQYDLYVFTTEGAYSFDTGTEINYNRKTPASLEIPTSDIICSTPYGVVFVGSRGLYMINGQEVKLISEQLEQPERDYNIAHPEINFLEFLGTIRDILYNPAETELIIVGEGQYNYVLNIKTGMYYLSTEAISHEVKNAGTLQVVSNQEQRRVISVPGTPERQVIDVAAHWNNPTIGSVVAGGTLAYILQPVGDTYYGYDANQPKGVIITPSQIPATWDVAKAYNANGYTTPDAGLLSRICRTLNLSGQYWSSEEDATEGFYHENPDVDEKQNKQNLLKYMGAKIVSLNSAWVETTYRTIPAVPATYTTQNCIAVKDYTQSETPLVEVSFVTRPLFIGIDEVKKLQRMILRGLIYQLSTTGENMFYNIYGSNDSLHYLLLRGQHLLAGNQNRNFKDIDNGLMTRSTYRSYIVKFEARVDERTELQMIDCMVDDNYGNDKMR